MISNPHVMTLRPSNWSSSKNSATSPTTGVQIFRGCKLLSIRTSRLIVAIGSQAHRYDGSQAGNHPGIHQLRRQPGVREQNENEGGYQQHRQPNGMQDFIAHALDYHHGSIIIMTSRPQQAPAKKIAVYLRRRSSRSARPCSAPISKL